jgi:histidinol-phosphate aminotransferase
VFIRMPGVAPLDRCIRISTAPDDELDVLAAELPSALVAADRPDREARGQLGL